MSRKSSQKYVPRRKPSSGNGGISLFPFMAVLLCTMGALIMLLVLVAKNVRDQDPSILAVVAQSPLNETPPNEPGAVPPVLDEQPKTEPEPIKPKKPEPPIKLALEKAEELLEKIKLETEEADWFTENFLKSKKDSEEKLAEEKTRLAMIEKETQKVKDEIKRLDGLAMQLENGGKASVEELENLKKQLEQRKQQRLEVEKNLQKLQEELAEGSKSYAIIPYRGTGGTFRRPIYIECRDGKVIIQPEGVVLTEEDFLLSHRPDNPLDAAMRVIRQYYMETNQIQRGTEPYPLLVVRPSGVEAYSAARRAFGSWLQEYGYELVDEDWKMQYPEPSEELRERIEKQLQTSRSRIQGYLAAMHAQRAEENRAMQYRLDHKGGVQALEGAAPGRGGSRGPSGNPRLSGMDRPTPNRNATVPTIQPRTQPGQSGMPGTQFPARGEQDISLSTESNSPNNPQTGTETGAIFSTPDMYRKFGAAASNPAYAASHTTTPGQQRSGSGEPLPLGLPPDLAASNTASQPGTNYGVPETTASTTPNDPNSNPYNPNNPQNNGQKPSPVVFDGRKPEEPTTTPNRNNTALHAGVGGLSSQDQYPHAAPAQSVAPLAPSVGISTKTPSMDNSDALSQPGATASMPRQRTPSPKVENWALRDVQPFSAAIRRNVKIQCEADKFVLVEQPGLRGVRVVPITDSIYASTENLVRVLWEFMDSWGIAGEKMFWKPVLQINVQPGGERRFQELRTLLYGSGLEIEQQ